MTAMPTYFKALLAETINANQGAWELAFKGDTLHNTAVILDRETKGDTEDVDFGPDTF
jgi:hypothetical protein